MFLTSNHICPNRINLTKFAGITKLIIECDATEAVKLLSSNSYSNRLFNPISNDYRSSLWAFQEIKIQHYFREANKVVDLLTKVGCHQATPFLTYFYPPNDVIVRPRLVREFKHIFSVFK